MSVDQVIIFSRRCCVCVHACTHKLFMRNGLHDCVIVHARWTEIKLQSFTLCFRRMHILSLFIWLFCSKVTWNINGYLLFFVGLCSIWFQWRESGSYRCWVCDHMFWKYVSWSVWAEVVPVRYHVWNAQDRHHSQIVIEIRTRSIKPLWRTWPEARAIYFCSTHRAFSWEYATWGSDNSYNEIVYCGMLRLFVLPGNL